MGYFEILTKKKLSEIHIGDTLPESDFSQVTPDGYFIQMKYIENDECEKYPVKPGIWTIRNNIAGMFLERTDFVHDKILSEFVSTKHITDKIDRFFNKLQIYYDYGIDVPKRGILLYGPPGTGKSTSIVEAAHKYGNDGETAVIIWATDKYESYQVREFIKNFNYVGVKRVILIVEDIGGVEVDQIRMKSDSSLLALLDNQEKIFSLPILFLATTNFPEIFMGNLTNRPGRFDDKIEVPYPNGNARASLFKFFDIKNLMSREALELMESNVTKEFSAAHIREVIIRSELDEKPMEQVIYDIIKEIESYKKSFAKKQGISMGINGDVDVDD